MKKKIVTLLFLMVFGFILLFKSMSIEVQAAEPTFRLISVERYSSFDKYTFSCSTKGYALGWSGSGNESYLIINDSIELKATASMSNSNYTSFVITDSNCTLNSKITKMKFTNVLELNSSNLPTGSLSGNPYYDINISNASFEGFSFYSSSADEISSGDSDSISSSGSSFSFGTIKPYIALGAYLVVWFLTLIGAIISISKLSKEKVLTYNRMKGSIRVSTMMFALDVIAWFAASAITVFNYFSTHKTLCLIGMFGGFVLNAITQIILRMIIGSKIDPKAKSIGRIKIGMTRDEIVKVLEVELKNDNTINVVKPYLNGTQTTNYSLYFDENDKLVNVDSKTTKRWTVTHYR